MTTVNDVYMDLIAEGDALDEFVAGLSPAQWQTQTPAPGWTITHQIAHLASVARFAEAAASHPDEFKRQAVGASGYLARGLTVPAQEFRFELVSPSGQLWEFGLASATARVAGPAVDFCLLATRRRHRDDLAVVASGAEADRWLDIAQAYCGSPGQGRRPGQFASTSVTADR